jgi:hypothetical protein
LVAAVVEVFLMRQEAVLEVLFMTLLQYFLLEL